MKKGLYIVIEGIDGGGKSTQLRFLESSLRSKGFNLITTQEPGGTISGRIVRKLLLDDYYKQYQLPKCQVLGYNYDRAMLIETVVKPWLRRGTSVITDRSWLSTIAYQHFGEKEDLQAVMTICEYAMGGCMPDQIFILDVSVAEAKRRMEDRPEMANRYDRKPKDFFENLREGYLWATERYSDIVTVINGERPEDEVAKEILEKVLELFNGGTQNDIAK